ncbi:MAG: AAA family ATPase [Phycisphaerales bacterium]|nr:MAG: AAA family ATPase [Phycisphaerales bacterium]
MSDASFTGRERGIVGGFVPLMLERSRSDAAMQSAHKESIATADRTYRGVAEDARQQAETARQAADAELASELKRAGDDLELIREATTRTMEAEVAAFQERLGSIENAAERELDDAAWLAETVVESAEQKASGDFSNASKAHTHGQAELTQMRARASDLLARQGHEGLTEASELIEGVEPPPPVVGQRDYDEARARATAALATLEERLTPAIVRTPTLVVMVLLFGAFGSAGSAIIATRTGRLEPWAAGLTGAGFGVALAIVVQLFLRRALRGRVRTAREEFEKSAEHARAMGDAWITQAETERDRQAGEIRLRRESEIRKARERFAAIKQELSRKRRLEEPSLREKHQSKIAKATQEHDEAARHARAAHAQRVEAITSRERTVTEEATKNREDAHRQADATLRDEREAMTRRWTEAVANLDDEYESLVAQAERLCPAWDDESWARFTAREQVPEAIRFGTLEVDLASAPGGLPTDGLRVPAQTHLRLPAMLDLAGHTSGGSSSEGPPRRGSLIVHTGPEGRATALKMLENVLLRTLTAFPPGKARFTIIDPVGLGQSFAGFMHLADYEEALVGDKIWTDPKRIEQKLTDLTEHMENVIQKYLRNEFASIQDYNVQAGEIAEPFRFLVIADFPAGISEAAAKRLASIAESGPRCGVHTLIVADNRQRPPAYVPMSDLERSATVLQWQGTGGGSGAGRFVWKDEVLGKWPLRLEMPPGDGEFNRLIHAVGRLAKDSNRVQVPFETVTPQPAQRWTGDASEELRIPVGRSGATKLQYVSLGRGTAQHALIAGRTGSGKSTLLHALVTNLSLWYSPDEVEYYLVDFKKGVEFKTYATHRVPHARVVAVESEREFGLSVLRRLDAELTRRGSLFRDAGVQDLAAYRRHARGAGLGVSPMPMPRTLLIVDEFHEFFVDDDKLAQEAALLLDRLVRQGRAFGIHVVLGSQTIGGAYSLARSTVGQMAVRIALQCSEADSYLIMSEDNPAARLLSRPGEAIYNDASGMLEGNSPFQVVWLPEEKREACLKQVSVLADQMQKRPPAPVVFEGNVPADLDRDARELGLGRWVGQTAAPRETGATAPLPRVYLGDPISIKEPTSVSLRRQSGSHLLLVGQQESAGLALCASSILSLASSHAQGLASSGEAFVHMLDAGTVDADQSPVLVHAARALGSRATYGGVRDAGAIVGRVFQELERRRQDEHGEFARQYLIVFGLHRFRPLRRSEDDFAFDSDTDVETRADKQFARIVRDGPTHGLHVITWCDSVTSLERTLDRRAVREFDARVAFQMSANDSSALVDSPQAVGLGPNRALLYTEETGHAEKFRPYALADPQWLAEQLRSILAAPAGGTSRFLS